MIYKHLMKRIAVLLILLHSVYSFAQTDTAFWFAAPDLAASHQQVPIRFCFTTYGQAATITISQPASSTFVTQTLNVAANGFATYDVSSLVDSVETTPAFTVLNRGFYITSTAPVSCYYECIGANSEIYNLKGGSALGTDFLIPSQNIYSNCSGLTNSVEIVATEDNTSIEITAPVALLDGTAANTTITILLNRGQSYSIQAEHLSNTIIHSDKPIAVNVTDDSMCADYCADLVGDQIVPMELLGTRYVALKNDSEYEEIFIFPTENNTVVTINGTPIYGMLNIGSSHHLVLNDTATHIEANKPISVFQLTASGCELGGTVLPQLDCTGSHLVRFLRPDHEEFILTLLTKTQFTSNFVLNGHSDWITAADFAPLASDTSFSYCIKDISNLVDIDSVMTLENIVGLFHCGIINGGGADCSYGYFSGYAKASYIRINMDSVFCPGDSIVFNFEAPDINYITLHGPNGLSMTEQPFVLRNINSEMSGKYWISGIDTAGCQYEMVDSIHIVVYDDNLEIAFDIDTLLCSFRSIDIHFTSNLPEIEPKNLVDSIILPNGTVLLPDAQHNFRINAIDSTFTGWWTLTAHAPHCASISDTDSIFIRVIDSHSLTIHDTIVENQLPWERFDSTFTAPASTTFFIPDTNGGCDSVINYELTIYYNTADTILYYICDNELPFDAGDTIMHHSGSWTTTNTGIHGEDINMVYILNVINSTDTTIYDTIINSQLPLFIYDTIIDTAFTDSIIHYTYYTYNEAGCDSIIYYNLFIFWNGDHCDTNLTYPNMVTPNGDGYNDKFVIGGLIENKCFRYNELIIYNSSGQKVYRKQNICKEDDWWDPESDHLPAGTYFFYFKAHGVNIHTQHIGAIEVLREK